MTPPKNKRPAEADDDLWARAMRDTKPLSKQENRAAVDDGATTGPKKKRAVRSEKKEEPSATAATRLPPLTASSAPGLDRRTAERLKKGQIPVQARLDLHRHTREEAHRALTAFIEAGAKAGRRCVLVITGKGESSGGVLRAAVPAWLNDAALRPKVLAFCAARPKDGGDGALYVLLKRARDR